MPLLKFINGLIAFFGRISSGCLFVMMALTTILVCLRQWAGFNAVALQELVIYLHGFAFLLAMSLTLQHDQHVRVDVIYQHLAPRTKHWINLTGFIGFFFPFVVFMMVTSWSFFWESWLMRESSHEAGGLPFVYGLKGAIFLGSCLLALQGLVIAITIAKQTVCLPVNDLNTPV